MRELSRAISRKIDKAIFAYNMISPGDRIAVGVSGGKDSLTLLHQLSLKQPRFSIPFSLCAVHVQTEYTEPQTVQRIRELAEEWSVPLHIVSLRLQDRLYGGHTMSCYWCSAQRRTELLRFSERRGINKIALGHHMDDILETFFINMAQKGELSTMLPVMAYDRYRQSVIRPLAWVTERETHAFAEALGARASVCRCGFDRASKRHIMRETIETIVALEGEHARERMYIALHNPRLRYLIRRALDEHDDTGRGYADVPPPVRTRNR